MKGIGTSIKNMVKERTRIQQVVQNIKVLITSHAHVGLTMLATRLNSFHSLKTHV